MVIQEGERRHWRLATGTGDSRLATGDWQLATDNWPLPTVFVNIAVEEREMMSSVYYGYYYGSSYTDP
jgi:hypothetical protein